MDKYIGRLLDNRYEILEIIGTGGMAVVYKARCHRLNRLVAIKILKDDYLGDEDFRSRFHSESQAVAMLSHPNIVSVYDVSTSVSLEADYIVMELIEGISLKQYMEKKQYLNWKETLHFAIQIAKALQHAHSRGIVHRDIKPHNIMVLKNGSVKVTDFGIARLMSQGNTLTKEALGSVHYISPEQAKGGRVDDRSDLYSLGVVMYEMMCGRPPYDGDSPVAVAIQHINGGAVMPSTINGNIPGGLEQIIMKAMANEPAKRYSSATQMLQDMDEFRKDPAILFDYNIPPLDAVIKMPKEPQVIPMPTGNTTAQRVANKGTPSRTGSTPSRTGSTPSRTGSTPSRTGSTPSRNTAPQKKSGRKDDKNWIAIVAVIVCAVALLTAGIFLLVSCEGQEPEAPAVTQVPAVVGDYYEDLAIKYPDVTFVLERKEYHESKPAGMVLEQDPAPQTEVPVGQEVAVVISDGPAPLLIPMPNLLNYKEQTAMDYLNSLKLDLDISIERQSSETVESGYVISTQPEEEVILEKNSKVTLVISAGPEIKTISMPDLIRATQENAEKTLENQKLHLKVEIEEIFDSAVPKGQVVKTEPDVGEKIKTGEEVTLFVSKGPELKLMPNLVDMDITRACEVFKTSGFVKTPKIEYDFSDTIEKDRVIEQSVEANTEADVNTELTVTVSKGPEPPVVTTQIILFTLPEGRTADALVEIRCNGEVPYSNTVATTETTVSLSVTGTGKQTYELWIDGAMVSTQEVDFSAGT